MRLLSSLCCCALIAASVMAQEPKTAEKTWVTIKGQVIFPSDKPIPKQLPLNVGANNPACLVKGPILDESILVHPKNRGIKNVVVFLRPLNLMATDFGKDDIHPDDSKRKAAEFIITQPCCMFVERVLAARVGDTIVVNNPATIVHNFFWTSGQNGNYNPNIPAMNSWKMPQPLVAENSPIQYKCTVHPWMTGYVRIFNHPYFAVTDEDGKFEIKNAPTGQYRIVYWHETAVRGGKNGRFGEPINIAGKTMELKPVDFEVKPQ